MGYRSRASRFGPAATWWAGVGVSLLHRLVVHPVSVDLAVYRATAGAFLHGRSIYGSLHLFDHLQATYPPVAALVFVPLWLVSPGVLSWLVAAVNVALVLLATWLAAGLIGVPPTRRRSWALVAGGVALLSEPVAATLDLGQIELALLVLVLADLGCPRGARFKGAGIGLATAIKLTPGIFVLYLFATGRRREALVAASTVLAATAIGWLALTADSLRYWQHLVFDIRRVGLEWRPDNQSVRGAIARVAGRPEAPPWSLVLVAAVLVAGLILARHVYAVLGEGWGATTVAVTGLLVSPISWTDHWVWCVPIAMLLAATSPTLLVTVAIFWTYAVRLPPNPYHHVVHLTLPMELLSDSYVLAGVAVMVLGVVRMRPTPAGRSMLPTN